MSPSMLMNLLDDGPMNEASKRFDRLLEAMANGEAPTAKSQSSGPSTSTADDRDGCDETQTRPDTSEDASG